MAMLKYLRIAVTGLSLTACVLLVALWVRSYGYSDGLVWRFADSRELAFGSKKGQLSVVLLLLDKEVHRPHSRSWNVHSTSIKQIEEFERQWRRRGLPRWGPRFRLGDDYLLIPHWFTVLLIAILAAVGGAHWIRYRFSLRTLLIATTLVAVALGIVVAAT